MPNIQTCFIRGERAGSLFGPSRRFVANLLTLSATPGDVLWDVTNDKGVAIKAGSLTTAWIDKGAHPIVAIDGAWVTATGTPLVVRAYGTNDLAGVVIVPLPYVPSVAATGVTPIYPQDLSFPKASWGNAATCYVGGVVAAAGWRYIKIQASDANASGSFTAGAAAGASG